MILEAFPSDSVINDLVILWCYVTPHIVRDWNCYPWEGAAQFSHHSHPRGSWCLQTAVSVHKELPLLKSSMDFPWERTWARSISIPQGSLVVPILLNEFIKWPGCWSRVHSHQLLPWFSLGRAVDVLTALAILQQNYNWVEKWARVNGLEFSTGNQGKWKLLPQGWDKPSTVWDWRQLGREGAGDQAGHEPVGQAALGMLPALRGEEILPLLSTGEAAPAAPVQIWAPTHQSPVKDTNIAGTGASSHSFCPCSRSAIRWTRPHSSQKWAARANGREQKQRKCLLDEATCHKETHHTDKIHKIWSKGLCPWSQSISKTIVLIFLYLVVVCLLNIWLYGANFVKSKGITFRWNCSF